DSNAEQPSAALRGWGVTPRHLLVDEWDEPASTLPAGATPHPAKPRVLGPRGAGRSSDRQTGSARPSTDPAASGRRTPRTGARAGRAVSASVAHTDRFGRVWSCVWAL